MPTDPNTIVILNELISLPIIISDYDAEQRERRGSSSDNSTSFPSVASSTESDCAPGSHAAQHKWSTGFSDFADEMWNRMTNGMKQKLREACVEVLKRTEEGGDGKRMSWEYDDDARFLD